MIEIHNIQQRKIITLIIIMLFFVIIAMMVDHDVGVAIKEKDIALVEIESYIITWRSLLTGKEGQGITRFFESKALDICRRANNNHSGISHQYKLTFPEN